MKNATLFVLFLSMFSVMLARSARATERPFTYTYGSGVLGQGQVEIEPWTTSRIGRRSFFNGLDQRVEFEVGVSERLQWAFYFNFSAAAYDVAGVRNSSFTSGGVSWEWKLKLLDCVADPVGLALYFEPTLAPTEAELEGKLIVDKRLGPFYWAANLVLESEWDMGDAGSAKHELYLEADVGATYYWRPRFATGIEARSLNEDGFERSVLHAGPVVSYAGKSWWIAATFLPQLFAPSGADQGHLDLAHHERFETRLIFGLDL